MQLMGKNNFFMHGYIYNILSQQSSIKESEVAAQSNPLPDIYSVVLVPVTAGAYIRLTVSPVQQGGL